ncbi:MAG TPA: hypothetical protein VGJ20_23625 [Xanthobacteraceae bacterium]|jgi:hypothetical protein
MHTAGLFLASFVVIMFAAGAGKIAQAAEAIMLRAGEVTGPNAVFAFDKDAKPQRIVVRTTQVGVAGSRIEVTIDKAKTPVFSHIFATTECKFGDRGSNCEVTIPATNTAYAKILARFKRGLVARVTIADAGVMKMDQTASLRGFTKSLR